MVSLLSDIARVTLILLGVMATTVMLPRFHFSMMDDDADREDQSAFGNTFVAAANFSCLSDETA